MGEDEDKPDAAGNLEEEAIVVLGGDTDVAEQRLLGPEFEEIAKEEEFYSHILEYLTGLKFPEDEARKWWEKILTHKYLMSEKLGRNVGIRVAALDYFLNIEKKLKTVSFVDIDKIRKISEKAERDSLTRVFRRGVLFEKGPEMCEKAAKAGKDFSIIFFDIDNFKKYNDTYGHLAGDALLWEFAKILMKFSKNVFRYGGDEFIIFEDISQEEALQIGIKVRQDLKEFHFSQEKNRFGVGLTFGVSSLGVNGKDFNELLKYADENLYQWKTKKPDILQ